MFYASIKTLQTYNNNMFDIGCVTCRCRISDGSKTALSGDLQCIIIVVRSYCEIPYSIKTP